MYYMKIHEQPNHLISLEYNISAGIIIFNRESFVDGEMKEVNIGITVNNLMAITERIKYQRMKYEQGIMPPDCDLKIKKSDSYMDEM